MQSFDPDADEPSATREKLYIFGIVLLILIGEVIWVNMIRPKLIRPATDNTINTIEVAAQIEPTQSPTATPTILPTATNPFMGNLQVGERIESEAYGFAFHIPEGFAGQHLDNQVFVFSLDQSRSGGFVVDGQPNVTGTDPKEILDTRLANPGQLTDVTVEFEDIEPYQPIDTNGFKGFSVDYSVYISDVKMPAKMILIEKDDRVVSIGAVGPLGVAGLAAIDMVIETLEFSEPAAK